MFDRARLLLSAVPPERDDRGEQRAAVVGQYGIPKYGGCAGHAVVDREWDIWVTWSLVLTDMGSC